MKTLTHTELLSVQNNPLPRAGDTLDMLICKQIRAQAGVSGSLLPWVGQVTGPQRLPGAWEIPLGYDLVINGDQFAEAGQLNLSNGAGLSWGPGENIPQLFASQTGTAAQMIMGASNWIVRLEIYPLPAGLPIPVNGDPAASVVSLSSTTHPQQDLSTLISTASSSYGGNILAIPAGFAALQIGVLNNNYGLAAPHYDFSINSGASWSPGPTLFTLGISHPTRLGGLWLRPAEGVTLDAAGWKDTTIPAPAVI